MRGRVRRPSKIVASRREPVQQLRHLESQPDRRGAAEPPWALEAHRRQILVPSQMIEVRTLRAGFPFEREKHEAALPAPVEPVQDGIQRITRRPYRAVPMVPLRGNAHSE